MNNQNNHARGLVEVIGDARIVGEATIVAVPQADLDKAKTIDYAVEGLQRLSSAGDVTADEATEALRAFGMTCRPDNVWVFEGLRYGVEVLVSPSSDKCFVWRRGLY